jgi:hypothetical protein
MLCVIAAAGSVALAVADSELLEPNLVYTGLGLLLFGAIAVAGASATGRFAWLGWLAAVAAVAAFVFLMVDSWQVDEFGEGSETLAKLAGSFALFSFALAWSGIVLNRVTFDDSRATARLVAVTLLAMLAVATMLTVALVANTGSATYFRIIAVVAVLGTLAAALIPIARALRRAA